MRVFFHLFLENKNTNVPNRIKGTHKPSTLFLDYRPGADCTKNFVVELRNFVWELYGTDLPEDSLGVKWGRIAYDPYNNRNLL